MRGCWVRGERADCYWEGYDLRLTNAWSLDLVVKRRGGPIDIPQMTAVDEVATCLGLVEPYNGGSSEKLGRNFTCGSAWTALMTFSQLDNDGCCGSK